MTENNDADRKGIIEVLEFPHETNMVDEDKTKDCVGIRDRDSEDITHEERIGEIVSLIKKKVKEQTANRRAEREFAVDVAVALLMDAGGLRGGTLELFCRFNDIWKKNPFRDQRKSLKEVVHKCAKTAARRESGHLPDDLTNRIIMLSDEDYIASRLFPRIRKQISDRDWHEIIGALCESRE